MRILVGGIRLSYGGLNTKSLNECHAHKKRVRKVPSAQWGLNLYSLQQLEHLRVAISHKLVKIWS
jgi:hypothetical protein